jgi:hypothetical protein
MCNPGCPAPSRTDRQRPVRNVRARKYDIACGQIDIGIATSNPDPARLGPQIDVARVGHAIFYMAGSPLVANVVFLTVMPTKMPFLGRG